MKRFAIRAIFACLAITLSVPVYADRDDHGWRSERRHGKHRHHHHDHYRDVYQSSPCRGDGWYDHHGRYRERRVCQEARVSMPAPALMLAPPSIVIQAPGIYLR